LLAETNHLLEYNVSLKDDVALISRKNHRKKTKHLNNYLSMLVKKEIEKHARLEDLKTW